MGAKAILGLRVMPESVDIDLAHLKKEIQHAIQEVYGNVGEIRVSEEAIAFGLRALKFEFVMDESFGSDPIEEKVSQIEGVASAQVIDFRRTLG